GPAVGDPVAHLRARPLHLRGADQLSRPFLRRGQEDPRGPRAAGDVDDGARAPGALFRVMLDRAVRYFVVGGISAVFDIGFFYVFAKLFGYHYLAVACVGFVFAVLLNYALSVRFVFTSGVRFSRGRELALVYLVSGVGLALHLLVLYAAADLLGLELMLSKVIATGSVFLWNFLARNYFI